MAKRQKRSAAPTPETTETIAPTEGEQVQQRTETTAPEPKKEPKKPTGMMADLKTLVFENPSLTVDALRGQLQAMGHNPSRSSISTIRADFLHSLRCLHFSGVRGLTKFVVK